MRLLIADDEPDILAALEEGLPSFFDAPLEVEFARDGEQALAKLREHGPYDLVLCDERMPGPRGLEVLAHVGAASPRTVRVLMTAHNADELRARAAQVGAAVVAKPFTLRTLAERLRQAIGKPPRSVPPPAP